MKNGANLSRREAAIHAGLLIVLGLLISWPLLLHGLPDLSNDGHERAAFNSNFARQFWSGDLYPRWLMNMNGGLGSPDFFFYQPLQSFVSALFWPLLRTSDPHGWLISGYASVLATVLSGLTAYMWIRTFTTSRAAVIGAAVYMIAPYHLAIDLYNRGAAGEYLLFVWLPLVMLSVHRLVQDAPYATVWLALSYALCVLSHGTVSAVFAAVPFAYVVFLSTPGARLRQISLAAAGIAGGIGISGLYLLPAMLDRGKAQMLSAATAGWADYRNWWLFQIRDSITEAGTVGSGIPWYLSFKMRIMVITLWMLGFAVAAYFFSRDRSSPGQTRRTAAFYLGVTLVTFFLTLKSSDFVWRIVPVLPLLQFSSRLGTTLVLAVAPLSALAYASLTSRGGKLGLWIIFLSMAGWLAADVIAARQGFSAWRNVPAPRAATLALWTALQSEDTSFWPLHAPRAELMEPPALARFVAAHPPKAVAFTSGSGELRVADWGPRRIDLRVSCLSAGHVVVNYFYYEGWRARQKQSGAAIPLTPTADGFMDLALPQGTYDVVLDLPRDTAEQAGLAVSVISLLICAGVTLRLRLLQRQRRVSAAIAPAR